MHIKIIFTAQVTSQTTVGKDIYSAGNYDAFLPWTSSKKSERNIIIFMAVNYLIFKPHSASPFGLPQKEA
jgi:hypothetical protein